MTPFLTMPRLILAAVAAAVLTATTPASFTDAKKVGYPTKWKGYAYGVKAGDRMYRADSVRVQIW